MNEEEVKEVILKCLQSRMNIMGMEASPINEAQSLTQSGVLDSFAFLAFLSDVENELKIELDYSELDPSEFTSVKSIHLLFARILNK